MRVVCTAGHVDHGKSTLVRTLTGMEPDRLEEERRRGLTIELGFAWTDLASDDPAVPGQTVAFVDLPGHERFVPTMLAGAGAVEVALFVVAADEGWKPQSAEHLAILDLLGVDRGVVAVTKADAVSPDARDLAVEEVRERLAGSVLAVAPVLPVSATTGAGLDGLRRALLAVCAAAGESEDRDRPRLWVDRSFSVRGAGTVVTGTLAGGRLRVGDDLAVLPGRRHGRVRGLQTLLRPVDEAGPGSRVAVNLASLDRSEIRRGDALGRAGQWRAATALEARVRALPGGRVEARGAWHLHVGSAERLVRVTTLLPGPVEGSGDVRLELDRPLPLVAGDRFVLREAGRRATVGGGVVLDAHPPPRPRGAAARRERVAALDRRAAAVRAADPVALAGLAVVERGVAALDETAAAAGLPEARIPDAARAARLLVLTAGGRPHGVAPRAAAGWALGVREALEAYHAAHPLDRLAPREEALRAARAAGCPAALAAPFLEALARIGRVVVDGPGVRAPAHRVALDLTAAAARQALLADLARSPFTPPHLAEAASRAGASPALVRELEAAGDLVRLGPDLAVPPATLEAAVRRLASAAAVEGPLTAARAKEVLGTTRKYALPLLEELDRRGRTRRTGDVRTVVG